ncbi:hypothetical protein [Haloarcula amylovorans]|uniref:hypothetical protein n=1 Tax=Haloarcula amylovorans TaxID=2562280 RepID=UPI00107616E3|nr:hypothetical protein [Halomicroarcula amylolytica]
MKRRALLASLSAASTSMFAGCSSLSSDTETIEVTNRDVSFEDYTGEAENSAQLLLDRDDQTLAISGYLHTSGTVSKLVPQVSTAAVGRNIIDVTIEPSLDDTQNKIQIYQYLTLLRFNRIPDTVEVSVQHNSGADDTEIVLSRVFDAPTPSQESP